MDDFYGDRFRWFVGVVKDIGDDRSRVRVRIFGIHHTEDVTKVSDGDLPWALVLYPTTGGQASSGNASHNLTSGSWVVGFFMDGIDSQQPIVIGSINGGAESTNSSPAENTGTNPSNNNGTGGQTNNGSGTALLAAGTNDYGNYDQAYAGVIASAKALQSKGYTPVIVLPSQNVNGSANAYNAASKAAADLGLQTVNPANYGGFDSDGYHISSSAANAIRQQYSGASAFGDSNAVRLGATEGVSGFTGASGSKIANNINSSVQQAPSGSPTTDSSQLTGGSNTQKVYNFFWQKLTQEGAYSGDLKCIVSAIVGNLQGESGQSIDPQSYNANDKGAPSAGIAQWRNGKGGRMIPFLRFCGINTLVGKGNLPPLEKQLDYMWHELHTSEKSAFNKLIVSTTIQDAVAGMIYFERDDSYQKINGVWMVNRNHKNYTSKLSKARKILSSMSYTGSPSSK